MTAEQIREHNERIAKLREDAKSARAFVRKAYEPVEQVKAQAGPDMDFSKVTILKGTVEEKEDAFGKTLSKHDEAFKAFKAADKALKAELKAYKADKTAEKIERKAAKKAKKEAANAAKNSRAEAWRGVNMSFGVATPTEENSDGTFDWSAIKVPGIFDNYNPKGMSKSQAYSMGQVVNAQFGQGKSKAYAKAFVQDVFQTKALGENVNEQGAGWIPVEFYPVLTQLIEDYGVARRNMTVWPMKNGVLRAPRLNALTQVYGEDEKIEPTEGTFDMTTIEVTARKFMGISYFPTELLEDSPMAIGDIVTRNYAMAMAKKEDQCLFLGDGTKTYNKTIGLQEKLLAISATRANIGGLYQSTHSTMATLTRTDIVDWLALLPAYAYDLGTPVIYCNQAFYQTVLRGAGAISQSTYGTEVVNGIPRYKFDGYDVVLTQVLPRTDGAAATLFAWFGVLGLSAKLGDARAYSMKVSDQYKFGSDQITYLATERIGIVVHDVGEDVTNFSGDTPYSPMVALATAGTLS